MLFNSLNFALFLPIVFALYWLTVNRFYQNILLLAASYFFYASWDYRFLFLLIFSTALDYSSGIMIAKTDRLPVRKFWLWLSIVINLGFLGFFKYYNFFAVTFAELVAGFGFQVSPSTLNVILPIGISFYTFHGLSYILDIYNRKIEPERNFVDYSLFVSFFPLLVAGPIERATHLLPQIKNVRIFRLEDGVTGLRQILWGLFKKLVIADSCGNLANPIFSSYESFSGSDLVLGAVLFSIQIYCDFSGYSDIAIGTARLFGIDLLRNFAFPYFSRDIAEFWRRWHMSLSSWFRDYLYLPLGGSKGGRWKTVRNIFIIFIVSGFWHGANWTYVVWGLLNATFFVPLFLLNRNRSNLEIVARGKIFPSIAEFLSIAITFSLVTFAWIFFRLNTVHDAVTYIQHIFSPSLFTVPSRFSKVLTIWIVFFFVLEWLGREDKFALESIGKGWGRLFRWSFYFALILVTISFQGKDEVFIYFQF